MNLIHKECKTTNFILKAVKSIEMFFAVVLIISVLINAFAIFPFLKELANTDPTDSYNIFQKFLSLILLLVIGLELSLMLIRHTTSSVIHVIIYAVARKMLIYNSTAIELLLGVVTLAILFIISKCLLRDVEKTI